MAAHTHDDGFHEIQLNGKQLVFLFMAATVVSVVIFLCGVLVGRGVRAERTVIAQAEALNEAPTADPVPTVLPGPAVQAQADPTVAAPPPIVEDLSYFDRLEKPGRQADVLKPGRKPAAEPAPPSAAKPSAPPAKPATPEKSAPPEVQARAVAPAPASEPASTTEAPGAGYAVQVAALNVRSEADAIAKRLTSRGYAAYVQVPPGSQSVFRVRVGTFKTRREAETIAARLQKEEQFKPWVTR